MSRSLWSDTAPPAARRPALPGDVDADVAVIGAGYTGLWTAYYLLGARPDLRVVVIEAEHAGFGASGRNGGWCSALFPVAPETLAREAGAAATGAQYAAVRDSVDEIVRVAAAEGIDADIAVGGTVVLARSQAQLARAREEVAEAAEYGIPLTLLDAAAARAQLAADGVLGGSYTPHCAALHPLKLARGLAAAVEHRGARLAERTRALRIEPGRVVTDRGTVRAQTIVRATEGFTGTLAGAHRALVPIYSLMVATEPLPDRIWDEIGLSRRETFSDYRHLVIYGQRTADGRLAFGGRGAPYHFGSRIRPAYDSAPAVFEALRATLVDLFPVLRDVRITHRWGGPLGLARDWHASVGLDRATGLAWAGGYTGDGVSTTNLAGRTLTDLILDRSTELTGLPWVGHRSPKWEPEPLRWLGANAALHAMTWADSAEERTGKPSRMARLVDTVLGR